MDFESLKRSSIQQNLIDGTGWKRFHEKGEIPLEFCVNYNQNNTQDSRRILENFLHDHNYTGAQEGRHEHDDRDRRSPSPSPLEVIERGIFEIIISEPITEEEEEESDLENTTSETMIVDSSDEEVEDEEDRKS